MSPGGQPPPLLTTLLDILQHPPPPPGPPQVGVSPFPGQKALLQQQPLAWLQRISFHPGYPSSPALATVLLRQCETRGHQVPSCFEPESEPEALVTTRDRCCCCGRACGQSHFSASASLMALFFLKMHLCSASCRCLCRSLNLPNRKYCSH